MEFIKKNPKIYVLSGKAHSGKNTVADIIADYYKGEKTINLAYASYLKMYAENVLSWDGSEETKPREFLQQVGVELIKNNIDSMMLINRIVEDIKVYSYFYDVIVITDARFKEEIETIQNEFDNVVSIHIYGKDNTLSEQEKKHATEVSLDSYNNYDYEVDNSGNLDELNNKVISILKECSHE